MPIVIYDKDFWDKIVDFEELAKRKLIDKDDLGLFKMVNSVDEAFEFLKEELSKNYLDIKISLFNNKGKRT
jgi:predicted Rossmann-fold nucleotide-binding protein